MGNRVKGRVKKKSIKAASHSGMGSKRKLSRMGKKQKKDNAGLKATFIGQSACLKRLQITLKDFRRLCILKGVYPREPRGKTPGNKKGQVFYHIKDVRAIAHEPILDKFREFRAFMRKVQRAAGRNEKDEAARMLNYAPSYTVHHLVRERYPRFEDALSDLDDALTLIYLFAALPSERRIKSKLTHRAKSLAASWGAYCATASSITKSFVSVKGVYLEANIHNVNIRWIIPHSFTQNLPTDVDYKVMVTFFQFYETLLRFVLYKLYNDIGIRFPLPLTSVEEHNFSSLLAANLHILSSEARAARGAVSTAVSEAVNADTNQETTSIKPTKEQAKKSRNLIKSVDVALNRIAGDEESDKDDDDEDDDVDMENPLKAALESIAYQEQATIAGNTATVLDNDAAKRRRLFAGLTFFLSREVPRGYLELICLAYGAKVGWEGDDTPVSIKDPSITHHIVDRPSLPASFSSLPMSREYIQPQWVLDSANFSFLLPCSRYAVGAELPPHLSPWVDSEEEGYKPAYAEEIERLKNGEILEDSMQDSDAERAYDSVSENGEADEKANVLNKTEKMDEDDEFNNDEEDESDEEDEADEEVGEDEEVKTDEEVGEDEAMIEQKVKKRQTTEEEDAKILAKTMMSKKAARLYGRMQHGLSEKQAKVDTLHRRRKEIESVKGKTPDGKTILKAKVLRLKDERRAVENDYKFTGGSMKKKMKGKPT